MQSGRILLVDRGGAGLIQSKLTKLPFEITNWLCGMRITLYSNEPDNMVAVMDCGDWELHGDGELQMLYGAASEAHMQA